ncbi:dihydrolipoamide dehydrogenase precursor [Paramecium bursaria]
MLQKSYGKFFFSAFDVVVIGGGPGGYVAAIKAAQLGLKTACIEKRGTLGGTCLNVGCIPSKALLNISHKYEDAHKNFKGMGIKLDNLSIDWDQTQKKKNDIVGSLTKGIEGLFAKNKVTYYKGSGRFLNKNEIQVEKADGSKETVQSKNTIIATGSEPSPFPGLDFDEKIIISSTGALALQKVPKKLLVIGGGVIGVEMASVYQRLGTEVTVVEFLDNICGNIDLEISKSFQKILTKQGIKFLLSHKVISGKNLGTSAQLTIEPVKGGDKITLEADHVLVSTGRRPFTQNLGAKEIGVEIDNKGRIVTKGHFKTSVEGVYAIGDVIDGPMLAHKAEEEGIALAEQLAGKVGHVNYDAIPGVIYTHPEVATVGKSEEELKKLGIQYAKGSFPFLANSRAKTNDDIEGVIKVLTDKTTDKILGVHIIGPNAGEMIAEAVLGIEYGAASEDIARTCHAHPTLSEALKEACLAAHAKAIHF